MADRIKKKSSYFDSVASRQDVPECALKLGEIHPVTSVQQSLGVRGKSKR